MHTIFIPTIRNKLLFYLVLLLFLTTGLHAQTADEIETLLNTNAVTYSQAVRFVLEAADIAAIKDHGEAFRYASEQNLLPKKAEPDAAITLEEISLVLMRSFKIKGGIFYTIAKNPHYAYRELVYKEIIQGRADPRMKVSGDQLLFIIGRLLSVTEQGKTIVRAKTSAKKKAEASRKEGIAAAINAGADRPLADNTTVTGMAANRRVEIIIVENEE